MGYGLYVLSPVRLGFFVTVISKRHCPADKTPATRASGLHDFAVRYLPRSSIAPGASTASHRNVRDDREAPLKRVRRETLYTDLSLR